MAGTGLEPIVAAGTHRVTWTLSAPPDPGVWDVSGEAELLPLRQPHGLVYGRAPLSWESQGPGLRRVALPCYFDYPVVYGEMNANLDVVLLDAHITVYGEQSRTGIMGFTGANAYLDAWGALVGHGAPRHGPILVDSAVIQVPHLEALAAKSPLAATRLPGDNLYETDKPEFTAEFDKTSLQEWEDDGAHISVRYDLSLDMFGWYSFGVAASPVVAIDLRTPIPLREFMIQWALPLRGIVSAATGLREDLTYMTCSPIIASDDRPANRRQFQLFNASITQQPYTSTNTLDDKDISAIKLSEGESLLELLRNWQGLRADENPILNTYDITAVGPSQHPPGAVSAAASGTRRPLRARGTFAGTSRPLRPRPRRVRDPL